ncbi:MAG: DUF4232 domain-containing protein, partial [Acidimicrobiales bacterium]
MSTPTGASRTLAPTTSTTRSPPSTRSALAAPCNPSAVTASAVQGSGQGGHESVVLTLTSRARGSCTLEGYPTNAWFTARNRARLEAVVVQQQGGGVAVVPVTLSSGR